MKQYLIPAALVLLALVSCDRTRNQKGYEYFPDMAHSLAYETYTANTVFANGITDQLPVAGTIPRGIIPFQYPATPEGRLQAGKDLVCPTEPTAANLLKGKELFTRFCNGCHGADGSGKGHLFTSGKFAIQPASLINERMTLAPIGEVYHVITMGFNTMGAHGPQIRPDDRWLISLYVKNELQKKTNQ
ncbi:MAG: cytochrome c [Bacteroidales bacterium]|nr:cytochrome c [Bacteroidales bacterium]